MLGGLTRNVVFFIVAAMAVFFLATSLATSRMPLTRTLRGFEGQAVDVLLWGGPPPNLLGQPLILESVNVISVGVHVFFTSPSGQLLHLKVAQPGRPTLLPGRVTIPSARYVQWNAMKLKTVVDVPAVSISVRALSGQSARS